jgi:calcineurin-like phosphoesterase family protein
MCTVRFIADLHLGHENMSKRRNFKSISDHDEFIISEWNSVVGKKDLTYILGDISMESASSYPLLDRLNGRKIVVLGNHDLPRDILSLLNYVDKVSGMIKYKGVWLTHCPVHPSELEFRVSKNIHGHIHENVVMLNGIPDHRYFCVSCENVGYKPKTLHQLGIKR